MQNYAHEKAGGARPGGICHNIIYMSDERLQHTHTHTHHLPLPSITNCQENLIETHLIVRPLFHSRQDTGCYQSSVYCKTISMYLVVSRVISYINLFLLP